MPPTGMGLFGAWASLMVAYGVAALIVSAIVHIAFALAVLADRPPRRVLVAKELWALGTLLAGPVAAAAYWVVHYGVVMGGTTERGGGAGEVG